MAAESNNLDEKLRAFYQRASEAEVRLKKLEDAVANNKGSGNEGQIELFTEFQAKLESVKAEQNAEKEKVVKEVQQLTSENAKLQYRILHLVRALKEADEKLAAK